jgi:hypothetical protein
MLASFFKQINIKISKKECDNSIHRYRIHGNDVNLNYLILKLSGITAPFFE